MFEAWGRGLYRARRLTLVIALLFAVGAGVAVAEYLAALPGNQVTRAATYWTSGQPSLVSADKHSTYAVLQLAGSSDQDREDAYKAVKADLASVVAAVAPASPSRSRCAD